MAEQKLTVKIPKTLARNPVDASGLVRTMFRGTELWIRHQKRGRHSAFFVFAVKGENVRDSWNSVKAPGLEANERS